MVVLFQFLLCWHSFGYFTNDNAGYMWVIKQKKWKNAIGIEFNTKKVLCSTEKSSVILAEPHSRSSTEQFCRTERHVQIETQIA